MITWMCDLNPGELVAGLRACKVRHHPSRIGLSREELWRGLKAAPAYFAARNVRSVVREAPVDVHRFEQLWRFLESL